MCILVIAKQQNPRFPLVIIHIREEILTRPTAEVHLDPQTKTYFARDIRAGGTWMGYNAAAGKVALLTNSYENGVEPPENPISRGQLVLRAMDATPMTVPVPSSVAEATTPDLLGTYAGFNLIRCDVTKFLAGEEGLTFCSNRYKNEYASGALEMNLQSNNDDSGMCFAVSNSFSGNTREKRVVKLQTLVESIVKNFKSQKEDATSASSNSATDDGDAMTSTAASALASQLLGVMKDGLTETQEEISGGSVNHPPSFSSPHEKVAKKLANDRIFQGPHGILAEEPWGTRFYTVILADQEERKVHYFTQPVNWDVKFTQVTDPSSPTKFSTQPNSDTAISLGKVVHRAFPLPASVDSTREASNDETQ